MFVIPILIIVIVAVCIRVVAQTDVYIIEFLGSYKATWSNGLHFIIPVFERIANKVSMKEQIEDFPPQPVITKDNVTIKIDSVVYYNIFDPKLYTYGVENPVMALATLTATTLRNIIGEMELDDTLTSRDTINSKMQQILDEATDKWGIKVNRVELKNIIPPAEIQEAMEKQMKAEREKRQTLLEAEANKQKTLLEAEATKQQAILESEAHKQASITRAQGDKEAMILHAEAKKEAAIAEAAGRAESIRLVYEAEAEGMRKLSEIQMSDASLTLKKLEALKELGDGNSTKLIVPTELAGVASTLSFIGDSLNVKKDTHKKVQSKLTTESDDCCEENVSNVTENIQSNEWHDVCCNDSENNVTSRF